MSDLEERLRATVIRRSHGYEPSAELPDRIGARVRRHRRRRQVATGSLAAAVVAATVVIVALVATDGDDDASIRMSGRDPRVTVPEPSSTTTPEAAPPSTDTRSGTTADRPDTPPDPAVGLLTPLSLQGLGPITAGMTLAEAQGAAGVTITPSEPGSAGSTCTEARIEGLDTEVSLVVELSGQPAADLMDGVVRVVVGVLETDQGVGVGSSRDELVAALGQPTRIDDQSSTYGPGADFLVFESGGHAFGAMVFGDLVVGLQSGDASWVSAAEGCPGG